MRATALTFFLGSVFFTSAAFLQYRGVAGTRASADWWASAVQLAGTSPELAAVTLVWLWRH